MFENDEPVNEQQPMQAGDPTQEEPAQAEADANNNPHATNLDRFGNFVGEKEPDNTGQ